MDLCAARGEVMVRVEVEEHEKMHQRKGGKEEGGEERGRELTGS